MLDADQTLDPAICGHREVSGDILRALSAGRFAHAHLFSGPAGIGKRLIARAVAKALVCESPAPSRAACHRCRSCVMVAQGVHSDVREWRRDKSQFSVDLMRDEVLEWASRRPREGSVKIGILDEVETFSPGAANAFLKTLEEPPAGTHWILVTSDVSSTLSTILSRCRRMSFAPLGVDEMERLLAGPLALPVRERLAARPVQQDGGEDEEEGGVVPQATLSPGERSFLVSFSAGSPGRLLELLEEDTMALRDWLTDQFTAGAEGPLAAADGLLKRLTREGDETQEPLRRRLVFAIGLVSTWVRDWRQLVRGTGRPLIHGDRRARLERLVSVVDDFSLELLEDRLAELAGAVKRNANLKIVAGSLLLEIAAVRGGAPAGR